jgi:D-aspartate ligase
MPLPPAVLVGGEHIAVSAARSLYREGVQVFALGAAGDPIRCSRACASFTDIGGSRGSQERCLEWLERGPRGAVLLPCNDDSLELVAHHRAWLLELGYLPIEADDEVLLAMLDKKRTYELARAGGIDVPRTITLQAEEDLEAAASSLGFPCALKPVHSHRFAWHFGLNTKVFVAHTRPELSAGYRRLCALGLDALATEIVPGPDDAYASYFSYIDESGKPMFDFTKRKLRQFPPHFGLACYHVTDWNPALRDLGRRFFASVGLRGVGNVEFKRDSRDGRFKLIECNPRFTGANELVRRAGFDIPLFTYRKLAGLPLPPMKGYRTGMHMWHPLEDVMAMRRYRRRGELGLASWAHSLLHRQTFPMWRLDDPLPTIFSVRGRIGHFVRRLLGGGSRARVRPRG